MVLRIIFRFMRAQNSILPYRYAQPAYHAGISVNHPISERIRLGANLSFVNINDQYKNLANGFAYMSFGDANTNITLGYGYGYPIMDAETNQPTQFIPISFKARFNRHLALISENWLFLNTDVSMIEPAFSYGVRFTWEQFSVDLALASNQRVSQRFTIGVPLINFSYIIID